MTEQVSFTLRGRNPDVLTEGLASNIPNLVERVDHILTKQVFGIGITRLTSLLARRVLLEAR